MRSPVVATPAPEDLAAPVIAARGICKSFPGVRALHEVDLEVGTREVHALLGENGAGKSTLMNVLAGALKPDAGQLVIDGVSVSHLDAVSAQSAGIGFIRQEPNVLDDLSVMENMTLGSERRRFGMFESPTLNQQANECLARVGLDVDPRTSVASLAIAQKQLLAIAKVLFLRPRIMIMDEPTAPLTFAEGERLFEIVAEEVAKGGSVIYISHRLEEIMRIADRATILRNGELIGTVDVKHEGLGENDLVRMMVGRDLDEAFPEREPTTPSEDASRLVFHGLLAEARPDDPDLVVSGGEVLGIAGLVGSGRTELVEALFGVTQSPRIEATLDGKRIDTKTPAAAAASGVALVPEDRRRQGFVGMMSIEDNVTMAVPDRISLLGVLRRQESRRLTADFLARLKIKAFGPGQHVGTLSGGNQQKVVIAKWMVRASSIFVFDEPTKGVDVGARSEIYREIEQLASEGKIVIVVSSEMPEILGLSDQILVMHQGTPASLLSRSEADAEKVLLAAFGRQEDQ